MDSCKWHLADYFHTDLTPLYNTPFEASIVSPSPGWAKALTYTITCSVQIASRHGSIISSLFIIYRDLILGILYEHLVVPVLWFRECNYELLSWQPWI